MGKGVIKNGIIIIVILALAFISQQHFFDSYGKNTLSFAGQQASLYWHKVGEWFSATIYPRVQKEAAERGQPLKEEVEKQKDNAVKIIWENVKNYFAEKFSKVSGTKVE